MSGDHNQYQKDQFLDATKMMREWVGLTDAEALDVWGKVELGQTEEQGALLLYKAFEAKLKEKNAYGWQSVENVTEYLDDLRGGADLNDND
jgi:hypothetical protein